MILDRSTLITGSFNFTKAAEEKNAENLLILKGNKTLVDSLLGTLRSIRDTSKPVGGMRNLPGGFDSHVPITKTGS